MSWEADFGKYPDNWDEISKSIKRRDKWTCQVCGRHSYDVDHFAAHHIKSNRKGPSTSSNLITVCDWCHSQLHNHVVAKSPPPRNQSKAKRRIHYLKNHPEISSSQFKQKFKPTQKKASPPSIFLVLMLLSLVLLAINFVLWVGVEIVLALAWGIRQKRGISFQNGKSKRKSTKEITVGSKVRIRSENDKENKTYTIKEDMDLEHNVITPESPVGTALIGQHEGEEVKVEMPSTGTKKFKILKVEN